MDESSPSPNGVVSSLPGQAYSEPSSVRLTTHTSLPPDDAPLAPRVLDLYWTGLRRGRKPVLAPARVTLPAGAAVGLVGVNGAGKSTLFMALAGVLSERCGQAAAVRDGLTIQTVGYVPQRPTLAPWLSVRDALALQGVDASAGLALSPVAAFLAPLMDRRADALSGGQLQLVATAGILARNDPLVLLDEPFAGVDLRHRAALVACVAEHRRRSPESVIILASHLAVDLHAICDWFVVLSEGVVVFAGPRDELPPTSEEAESRGETGSIGFDPTGVTVLERRWERTGNSSSRLRRRRRSCLTFSSSLPTGGEGNASLATTAHTAVARPPPPAPGTAATRLRRRLSGHRASGRVDQARH